MEEQSLLHRSPNGGRECAWRTNSLVGQFLHQLFLVQKFKIHSAVADSPMAKLTYFSSVVFLRGDQSLLHRSTNSGKECAWRNNYLVGQFLHQVSLVQRSKSIEQLQTISVLFFFSGRTSLCFAYQETQEENVLGEPTPLCVRNYTSHLLYKVQDPFSTWRQSHGQNILL